MSFSWLTDPTDERVKTALGRLVWHMPCRSRRGLQAPVGDTGTTQSGGAFGAGAAGRRQEGTTRWLTQRR